MKYVSFPWLRREAALSIFDVSIFVKNDFWKGIKKKKTANKAKP
jgi:hypothetical protein